MVWYGIDEENPLDTMGQANLWLWDGSQIVRGGYGQTLTSARKEWFDHTGKVLYNVLSWRAIMAWELHSEQQTEPEDVQVIPIYKRKSGS